MGSLGGHMSHLWEDLDLSFADLKDIMHQACSGNLRVTEKFDGINLHFRVDSSGQPRFASSASDREQGGLSQPKFINKYKNHPAKDTFLEATEAICQGSKKVYWQFGFSGRNWITCDFIKASRPMTLKYDRNAVVFHGLKNYTSEVSPSLLESFAQYVKDFSQYTVNVNENSWDFYGPVNIKLRNINGSGTLNTFEKSIDNIINCVNLDESSTIRDYAKIAVMKGMIENLNLSSRRKNMLLSHIFEEKYENMPTSLVKIKSGLSKSLSEKVSYLGRKSNRHKILNEAIRPIEIVITLAGSEVLSNYSSCLIENSSQEIKRIKSGIVTTGVLIESCDDGFKNQRKDIFKNYQEKLNYCSNSVSSIEGFVFEYLDKVYKITGTFAPVNHMLGIAKYGRGKVPAIESGKSLISHSDLIEHLSLG